MGSYRYRIGSQTDAGKMTRKQGGCCTLNSCIPLSFEFRAIMSTKASIPPVNMFTCLPWGGEDSVNIVLVWPGVSCGVHAAKRGTKHQLRKMSWTHKGEADCQSVPDCQESCCQCFSRLVSVLCALAVVVFTLLGMATIVIVTWLQDGCGIQ